jgi:hypothetical protein
MGAYVPSVHACLGAAGLALTSLLLVGLGARLISRGSSAETRLIAGWGALCCALTAGAVAAPVDLRVPLAIAGLAGAAGLATQRHRRTDPPPDRTLLRVLVLTLPLWAVMLPLRPSEIDTWWNLLPNAAYLVDHHRLPVEGGPESYSFLPAAPYNTQFVAFAASAISGSLAEGAMALFNLLLLCAAAALMARVLTRGEADGPPAASAPWWACGLGCLLVGPLDPGFVPRVFLSAYGETGLAVTAMFAVWLAAGLLDDLARGNQPRGGPALALALAAMVNIKQSGIGLVLPIGATMLAIAAYHPRIRSTRSIARIAACLLPAMALYALWRIFVAAHFPSGELRLLAVGEWNWPLLPRILAAVAKAMIQKSALFLCLFAVIALAARRFAERACDRPALAVQLTAGVAILFIGFLIFTYVAHFDPASAADAHSFFRYAQQLSLISMLALVCAARPHAARWLENRSARTRRRLATYVIALPPILPLAAIGPLRFDLDPPQPTVWALARDAAASLRGRRVALLLPGDVDDGVGSMLRGVMMFVPPRLRAPDFDLRLRADPQTLADVAASGYDEALISCTAASLQTVPGLAALPGGVAALLRHAPSGWAVVRTWPYPADLAHRKFAALIERAPLCAGPVRDVSPAISWHPRSSPASPAATE